MAVRTPPGGDSGTNLARVKDFNQVVVFDLVREGGPIGRPALAASTGLTLQTVSNITRRLLDAGVVIEEPAPASGRTRRVLRVNPDAGYALGIHFVRTHLAVGVVDLSGAIRAHVEVMIGEGEAPAEVMARLGDLVSEVVDLAGIPRDRLLGAGVGTAGPLDLPKGKLLTVIRPAAWSHFPIRDAIADVLGMRVIIDNDATAAALGEQWAGVAAGADDFVYLYLGTGLGCGLVLRGQAHGGVRGNAGEISHVEVEPGGPRCECGRRGCLGLYVTPDGLLREARRVALEAPVTQVLEPCPATLQELVASEDHAYAEVIARAGERLGRVATELCRVVDPELVVLGGPLVPYVGDAFAASLATALRGLEGTGAPAPRVEVSRTSALSAGVIGAATLILHDVYAPSARKLSLAGPSDDGPKEGRAA